jgi:hypothetical protein
MLTVALHLTVRMLESCCGAMVNTFSPIFPASLLQSDSLTHRSLIFFSLTHNLEMLPQLRTFLAWFLCTLLGGGGHQRANEYRSGHRPHSLAPESHLKSRRRALTSASSSNDNCSLSSQSASFLISKLPFEVRQMIWKYCLGGMTFHLHTRYNLVARHTQLYYIMCRSPKSHTCVRGIAGHTWD